jgi:membrane protein implicated in regulation of membrane protease activity
VLGASTLAAGFPALHGWTRRLADQQPATGMEALVGRTTVVEEVPGGRLVVRLDGVLWSIGPATPAPLAAGAPVVVRGWRGVVLAVEPVAAAPG